MAIISGLRRDTFAFRLHEHPTGQRADVGDWGLKTKRTTLEYGRRAEE